MTEQQKGAMAKWAAFATFAGSLAAAAVVFRPFLEWALGEFKVLFAIVYVQHCLLAVALGTAYALWVPWVMPSHTTSASAQARIKVMAGAISFTVVVVLNQSLTGVMFGALCAFAGPMVGMTAVRMGMWSKRYQPPSLQPTKAEAETMLAKAEAAVPGPGAK